MNQIILASGSEGRKSLFTKYFGTNFSVYSSDVYEDDLFHLSPNDMVQQLAQRKCSTVFQTFPDDLVCGFDTMVVCQDQVLGKPKNNQEAFEMLSFLNNKTQKVISGYAFQYQHHQKSGFEFSELVLSMTEAEIRDYILHNPVTNFAGAFAIQDQDVHISIISGNMDTIIGASMEQVIAFMKEIDFNH